MKKLPYTLMVVCLALIVLNIFVVRYVGKLEERIIRLEKLAKPASPPAP